ncbi:hypothetical protein HHI36_012682 [Cryptolaemus montrouzieri]|uniref:FLYWCH-type domain-containing protein n=1 Tax=Cryptolaemus montrouzieri TaxID=559131 RepID=A0ABD2NGC0_9CUCU
MVYHLANYPSSYIHVIYVIPGRKNPKIIVRGYIYITSGLKYPILVLDKYMFTLATKKEDKTTWVCRKYNWRNTNKNMRCKARMITYGKVVRLIKGHNHEPMVTEEELSKMIPQVVNIIRSE